MKLVRLLVAVLLSFPVPVPAYAADWWWLGTYGDGDDRFNAYIDNDSAQSDGKRFVTAWVFTNRATPFDNGELSARGFTTIDCQTRTYATGSRTAYDSEHQDMGTADLTSSGPQPVEAGSMAEVLINVACGSAQPRARDIANPLEHSLSILQVASADDGAESADNSGISFGTGFFVGPQGHLLTSYHVVEGAGRIGCRTAAGQIYSATLVRASQANDVALLRVNARPTHYLGFAPAGSAHEGDRVFTIGFPVVQLLGVEPRFTDGTISALSLAGENSFLQTSIPIQPGNSGGPVVTESGQVVGIIAATAAIEPFYRNTGVLPQNVNWAVKAKYAAPLLTPMPPAPRRTRDEAIALVRNSVCLIVAERAG